MSRTRVNTGFVAAGAINANTVLGDNVITANLIKTGAVGPTEIAAGAVSANTKIANGIITQNLIAAGQHPDHQQLILLALLSTELLRLHVNSEG